MTSNTSASIAQSQLQDKDTIEVVSQSTSASSALTYALMKEKNRGVRKKTSRNRLKNRPPTPPPMSRVGVVEMLSDTHAVKKVPSKDITVRTNNHGTNEATKTKAAPPLTIEESEEVETVPEYRVSPSSSRTGMTDVSTSSGEEETEKTLKKGKKKKLFGGVRRFLRSKSKSFRSKRKDSDTIPLLEAPSPPPVASPPPDDKHISSANMDAMLNDTEEIVKQKAKECANIAKGLLHNLENEDQRSRLGSVASDDNKKANELGDALYAKLAYEYAIEARRLFLLVNAAKAKTSNTRGAPERPLSPVSKILGEVGKPLVEDADDAVKGRLERTSSPLSNVLGELGKMPDEVSASTGNIRSRGGLDGVSCETSTDSSRTEQTGNTNPTRSTTSMAGIESGTSVGTEIIPPPSFYREIASVMSEDSISSDLQEVLDRESLRRRMKELGLFSSLQELFACGGGLADDETVDTEFYIAEAKRLVRTFSGETEDGFDEESSLIEQHEDTAPELERSPGMFLCSMCEPMQYGIDEQDSKTYTSVTSERKSETDDRDPSTMFTIEVVSMGCPRIKFSKSGHVERSDSNSIVTDASEHEEDSVHPTEIISTPSTQELVYIEEVSAASDASGSEQKEMIEVIEESDESEATSQFSESSDDSSNSDYSHSSAFS